MAIAGIVRADILPQISKRNAPRRIQELNVVGSGFDYLKMIPLCRTVTTGIASYRERRFRAGLGRNTGRAKGRRPGHRRGTAHPSARRA
jgi:hypothetical protein